MPKNNLNFMVYAYIRVSCDKQSVGNPSYVTLKYELREEKLVSSRSCKIFLAM